MTFPPLVNLRLKALVNQRRLKTCRALNGKGKPLRRICSRLHYSESSPFLNWFRARVELKRRDLSFARLGLRLLISKLVRMVADLKSQTFSTHAAKQCAGDCGKYRERKVDRLIPDRCQLTSGLERMGKEGILRVRRQTRALEVGLENMKSAVGLNTREPRRNSLRLSKRGVTQQDPLEF